MQVQEPPGQFLDLVWNVPDWIWTGVLIAFETQGMLIALADPLRDWIGVIWESFVLPAIDASS